MNLNIDDLQNGIRSGQQIQNAQAGRTQQISPLSSFALAKGAGAGTGRVQDVLSVDLTSSTVGTGAYAGRHRSAQDPAVVQEIPDDINAMVLLSHTLSGEDYARAMEDGYQPGDGTAEETVTILDRIKTAVIKSGKEVAGYTDTMDLDKLAQITGSRAYAGALAESFSENDLPVQEETLKEAADAVRMAQELEEPAGSAVKYLVENELDPTIRNICLANSATNGENVSQGGYYMQEGGYLAQKADHSDLEKLSEQIDAVVEKAGFTREEAGEEARWIVANDLPLTGEAIRRVREIESITFPVDIRTAADAAASALADGRPAMDGNLADPVSLSRKAVLLMQRQDLEEARLYLSTEANRQLLDKGVQIDTLPMEKLIEELKAAREEIAQRLFADADDSGVTVSAASEKYTAFEETLLQTQQIRTAPAAFIGEGLSVLEKGSLQEIAEKAAGSAAKYAQAQTTYEAVGTEVRRDLGDSIQKAFRNVDDILKEMGLEETQDNERAVRILGYNRMEITRAAVEEVREQDAKLRDVLQRLKPGAVLSLIRDGENPLKLTLDELRQELDRRGEEGDAPAEKYARFLYQLEKNGDISPEERESYIGIYRLFNTLKKTDHAAIGTVLEEGGEMTIGNLLTAVRTARVSARGIDTRVDDQFGGLEGGYRTPSISAQIESAFHYYSAKADSIYDHLDADRMHENAVDESTTLPVLAEILEETGGPESRTSAVPGTARAYADEQAAHLRETLSGEEAEQAAAELKQGNLPVTPNLVEAMRHLQAGRRRTDNVWDALAKLNARGAGETQIREALSTISDALGEGERFEEIYRDEVQEMTEELDQMMEDTETVLDLQTMLLMKRQLTVATRMADRGSYDIPVEVNGEQVNLHVTLREEGESGSSMTASLQTAEHGKLTLSLGRRGETFHMILNTSEAQNADEEAYLDRVRSSYAEAAGRISGVQVDEQAIRVVYRTIEGKEITADGSDTMEKEEMFRLAEAFVRVV